MTSAKYQAILKKLRSMNYRGTIFLGDWEDWWKILEEVIRPGDITLIPDLRYPSSEPLRFSNLTDEL